MNETRDKDSLVQQVQEQRVEAILAAIAARMASRKTRLMAVIIDRELVITEITDLNPNFSVLEEMETSGETVRWVENRCATSGRMAIFISAEAANRSAQRLHILVA